MVGRRRSEPPVYHLGLRPGDLPATVLIPGDPDRVPRIAGRLRDARPLARRREFASYRGWFGDAELGVVSSGIGAPAMAITVEELATLGVRTLIRVGSCGSLQPRVRPGQLVISLASARFESTTLAYAPAGYPAVADPGVVGALVEAARAIGVTAHLGRTASVDSFYVGEGRAGFRGYGRRRGALFRREYRELGLLNIEMESSALLTLAGLFGLRAGVVCAVYGDRGSAGPVPRGMESAIRVALEAGRRLAGRQR